MSNWLNLKAKWRPTRERGLLASLCLVTMVAICAATLWPFDILRPNGAQWLAHGGIEFKTPGILLSSTPLKTADLKPGRFATIELILCPAAKSSIHTVFGIGSSANPRQLLVRQLADGLILLHDDVGVPKKERTTRLVADHVFEVGEPLFLTISSAPQGTTVYKNGGEVRVFPGFTISPEMLAGQIVLGTSPARYDPWLGDLYHLALYSRESTPAEVARRYRKWIESPELDPPDRDALIAWFDFAEGSGRTIHNAVTSGPNLVIPGRFSLPYKPFLQSPITHFELSWDYAHDVIVNILGFVPLGFLLSLYWKGIRTRREALWSATLIGALLSLLIEILQGFIPQRDSGLTDVITNSFGAAIGALLAQSHLFSAWFARRESISTATKPGLPVQEQIDSRTR